MCDKSQILLYVKYINNYLQIINRFLLKKKNNPNIFSITTKSVGANSFITQRFAKTLEDTQRKKVLNYKFRVALRLFFVNLSEIIVYPSIFALSSNHLSSLDEPK